MATYIQVVLRSCCEQNFEPATMETFIDSHRLILLNFIEIYCLILRSETSKIQNTSSSPGPRYYYPNRHFEGGGRGAVSSLEFPQVWRSVVTSASV